MSSKEQYKTFTEFYPFYLSEHSNRVSRRLHFIGTSIALVVLAIAVLTQMWWLVFVALARIGGSHAHPKFKVSATPV